MEWGGNGKGWEGGGQFTSNLGPRWTGSYHAKEGFQVTKRGVGLKQQGISKGSKRQGDCTIIMLSICIHVYNNCLNVNVVNNLNCVYVINKPCVRGARYMRLISWTLQSGSEHIC